MLQTQILPKLVNNKRMLANLRLAVDKSLARKISSLNDQVRRICYQPEQADKVRYLRNEIINLEHQLSDVRERAL